MINTDKAISPEILKNLGVYELRELARTLGVSSPTTKKRAQLCEQILKISSGEICGEEKRNNKGRPPKSVTKMTAFVNEFIPQEILKIQTPTEEEEEKTYSSILMLSQNPALYNQICVDQSRQIYGYVNSINGHLYMKNLKSFDQFKSAIFYIPEELVNKFSIREGDKILGYGKMAEPQHCGVLDEILSINGTEILQWNFNRNNFEISGIQIPFEHDEIFGKNLKKGERTLSFFPNAEDAIIAVAEEMGIKKGKIVMVGVELSPEVIFYSKSKQNIELFATSYYNTLEESYNVIINCINYCYTSLKDGENVRLFVFDIMGMVTRLDLYFSSQENREITGHNVESIQLVKKLVGLGKAISEGLSITTHAIAFESEKNDCFIKNEIEKITKIL